MITIVIPTMNRSDYLIRLLKYYAATGYNHCISIGDSSNAYHTRQAKEAINVLEKKVKIMYKEYPDLNVSECMQQLIQEVSTPYIVALPDDDFVVTKSLEKCKTFLEGHPEFSAAHGVGVNYILNQSGAYGNLNSIGYENQAIAEEETACKRLIGHLNHYCPYTISVYRTEIWHSVSRNFNSLTDMAFVELITCCLTVAIGKVKQLDCLYLVRQAHDQKYLLPGFFDWILSPAFHSSYGVFNNVVAEELVRQDGISIDKARIVVKQAFKSYLSNTFFKPRKNNTSKEKVDAIFHGLFNRSPYFDDFQPIYRTLITGTMKDQNKIKGQNFRQ